MAVSHAADIEREHVERLGAACAERDVAGLAITEHGGWDWGLRAAALAADLDLDVLVLPGQENWYYPVEVVEIVLPSGNVFRFLAHPGAPGDFGEILPRLLPGLHGIEISNPAHDWRLQRDVLEALAEEHDLIPIVSSDAHRLDDIGRGGITVRLAELERAAAARSVEDWSLRRIVGGIG